MTVDDWLQAALADAERRGLPDLAPLLRALAEATRALRAADFATAAPAGDESGVHAGTEPPVHPPR
jgi:hypothetical protein